MNKEIFNKLRSVNVNDNCNKKNGLTYLSWAFAVDEFSKEVDDFSYRTKMFADESGVMKPYIFDELLGYMVYTEVTVGDTTKEMWLPVMDGANNAMKALPYKITTKWGSKDVAAASMFDINKTLMRCLVKNLAMFGLGIYIYAGEDLPEEPTPIVKPIKATQVITEDDFAQRINDCSSVEELTKLYNNWKTFEISNKSGYKRLVEATKDKKLAESWS